MQLMQFRFALWAKFWFGIGNFLDQTPLDACMGLVTKPRYEVPVDL